MKYSRNLFFLFAIILASSCINKTDNANIDKVVAYIETVVDADPFLKNSTYTYGINTFSSAVLVDTSYTPHFEQKLNLITVKINLDNRSAIVTTDRSIAHQIKSIKYEKDEKYFKYENGEVKLIDFDAQPRAVLTTNRGRITIAKPQILNDEYEILIEYGNYFAGGSISVLNAISESKTQQPKIELVSPIKP